MEHDAKLEIPNAVSVARELLRLDAERATGVLEVRAEGLVTLVYVADGVPVFAEEGTLGESLGRVLVRQGKLTPAQYSAVIEKMTRSVMNSEQLRFGEVAVALGFVTAKTIEDGLREQVRAKVARCLQWRDAELTFRDDAEAVDEVTHFPCPAVRIIWYGVRRFFDPERCRQLWGEDREVFPEVVTDHTAVSTALGLGSDETEFLRLLDGTRAAELAVQASSLDVVTASQLLATLVLIGAASTHSEPRELPSRLPAAPLPLPPFSLAPAAKPTTARTPSGPRRSAADAESAARIAERQRARLAAEKHFETGRERLFADDARGALPELLEAVRLWPSAAEYLVYAEWTKFVLIEDRHEKLLKRRELHGVAVRALRQDVSLAIAHYVLAELALLDRNEQGVQRAIHLALRCDPRHPLVQRFLHGRGARG